MTKRGGHIREASLTTDSLQTVRLGKCSIRARGLRPSASCRWLVRIVFVAIFLSSANSTLVAGEQIDFARDVLPILSDRCFHCHGPDANAGREGDLRLDSESDVKRDRDGDFVVKPGDTKHSLLIQRITNPDEDLRMPPPDVGRPLSEKQIKTLSAWVEQGAKWGRHWAFERIARPQIPKTFTGNPVDYFVNRELQRAGIHPNEAAPAETLIRRLSLDLTGLPPTTQVAEPFLANNNPKAWERAVDQTLASTAYGERMAWDWLDAARYADTNGYQGDRERTMWPWRDWVVRAFNSNLPYDKFTVWQLAGDLLPNATPEQILATGFNRNHMINGEGGRIAEENRVDYVFDMTETMGTVWLGLTLNCCRCHDHKFDPLTQKDYYQFTAFFNQTPVNGGGGNPQTPPVLTVPSNDQQQQISSAESSLAELKQAINKRAQIVSAKQADWETAQRAKASSNTWNTMHPAQARAKHQTLNIQEDGLILSSGKNPAQDEYTIRYALPAGDITGLKLTAVPHKTMTGGGLARSDSGNFVLTDISFEWAGQQARSGKAAAKRLDIASAVATFEQGQYKISKTFDADAGSGWAVYQGRPINREHAGVFRLEKKFSAQKGDELIVRLKFNSYHKQHNLGHFKFSKTSAPTPKLAGDDSLKETLATPANKRTKKQRQQIRTAFEATDSELNKLRADKSKLEQRIANIRKAAPKVMVMADMPKPRATKILVRGLYNQPGDQVQAATPVSLPPMKSSNAKLNRLDLARWLVADEHPLTARVTVNRFWQMLFGIGLVKTVEDFGVQAEFPVQRELLDWLAAEFIESGWDVKHLLKIIVTSDAYKRDSTIARAEIFERDPDNRWIGRGPRFRMPSWMIRDQALAVSGLLNADVGGQPVYSYQPPGIWSEATFGKKKYKVDKGAAVYRRSLYTYWRRIVGPTMFFDTARRQVCEVKTLRTNTPMHALNTFNSKTFVEAARALAVLAIQESDDPNVRLQFVVQRILGRKITAREKDILTRSLQNAHDEFARKPASADQFLAHGQSPVPTELNRVDCAAWTALCLNVLNLDETLNKE